MLCLLWFTRKPSGWSYPMRSFFGAALLPFGPFFLEPWLKREDARKRAMAQNTAPSKLTSTLLAEISLRLLLQTSVAEILTAFANTVISLIHSAGPAESREYADFDGGRHLFSFLHLHRVSRDRRPIATSATTAEDQSPHYPPLSSDPRALFLPGFPERSSSMVSTLLTCSSLPSGKIAARAPPSPVESL